jgi:hypothetical protein
VTEVCLCTVEDVKGALDVPETSRSDAQILREIQGSSRGIEGDLLRYFYPSVSTQTFDWPDHQYSTPWRLWLDDRELTSVTQVLAAGVDITSLVMLRPDQAPLRGKPFTRIEIDLSSNAAFQAGATFQRSISVTGTFGYCAADKPVGTITAFSDTVGTTGTVSDSSQVGVGNIIRVDTERMNVTAKSMTATGQTLGNSTLAAQTNANTVQVQSGAAVNAGETIQIDSEQMYIQAITGNNLTVIRAWNGTILAQHAGGTTIYAPRQITVERGVLGTTAATHAANATVNVHLVPPLIRDLCIAETLQTLTQTRRGYTQVIKRTTSGGSSGPGDPVEIATALDDLRHRVRARYGRSIRTRTAARLV